jgi:uncharacterized protein (DUF697 family)/GTP-binding protein EngB required for normal cell division
MQEYSQEAVDAQVQKMTADQKVPNILICGQTGVGKSSAVNYLFNDKVADTSDGEPCTKDITLYRHEDVNIYDSEGYEIGGEKQARYEKMLFDDFLLPRQGSIGEEAVHLVWYAVSGAGAKFTDLDAALVRRIEKAGYPAAVLLTKIDEMTETQLAQMMSAMEKDSGGIPIFPLSIWAKDKSNYPGLARYCTWDELIQWSYDHLAGVFKTRFVAALRGGLELKRKQAIAAVAAAAVAAGAVGASPIPFSDAALLVPIQTGMIIGIAKIYGVQISQAVIGSVGSGVAVSAIGKAAAGGLLKLIPGVGTAIGAVINMSVAASITGALGGALSALCYKQCKDQLDGKAVTIDIEKILTAPNFIADVLRRAKEAKETQA